MFGTPHEIEGSTGASFFEGSEMAKNVDPIPTSYHPNEPTPPRRRGEESLWRTLVVLKYLWVERRLLLAVALPIPVLYLISLGFDLRRFLTWEMMSTLGSVSGLIVGIAIFVEQAIENAEARLQKQLSVYFLYPGEETPCLVCRWAPLSGLDDIRQWGQQLGLQTCDHKDVRSLDFTPFFEIRCLGLERRKYQHHQAVFRLRVLPQALDAELKAREAETGRKQAKVMSQDGRPFLDDAAKYPYRR